MSAYSLTLGTVCNFSYSLPVPTVGQATVNPNPFINTGELIGSPEQLLTLPHMDTKAPDGDSLSFSVAMADRGRDAKYGSAQSEVILSCSQGVIRLSLGRALQLECIGRRFKPYDPKTKCLCINKLVSME